MKTTNTRERVYLAIAWIAVLGSLAYCAHQAVVGHREMERKFSPLLDEGNGILKEIERFANRTGRLPKTMDEITPAVGTSPSRWHYQCWDGSRFELCTKAPLGNKNSLVYRYGVHPDRNWYIEDIREGERRRRIGPAYVPAAALPPVTTNR